MFTLNSKLGLGRGNWTQTRKNSSKIAAYSKVQWLIIKLCIFLLFFSIDQQFASSSSTKNAGEIVGGVVGPIILLVVAYVVVKKRRCYGYRNAFPDMLNLVYNLQKAEKELEEEEQQEEGSSDKELRFSI